MVLRPTASNASGPVSHTKLTSYLNLYGAVLCDGLHRLFQSYLNDILWNLAGCSVCTPEGGVPTQGYGRPPILRLPRIRGASAAPATRSGSAERLSRPPKRRRNRRPGRRGPSPPRRRR